MQLQSCLPSRLTKLVSSLSDSPVLRRLQWGIDRLKHWSERRTALKEAEKKLHETMHPDVAMVLRPKTFWSGRKCCNLLTEDVGVVQEFASGSTLVGEAEATNLWPKRFSPATMTISELRDNACKERPNLHCPWNVSSDVELWQSVWDQTLQEVESGFLVGPLDMSSIPASAPINFRFGIGQGGKIRCVDDYSKSGVNSCAQVCESPKPHTVDVLSALALALMLGDVDRTAWRIRAFDLEGAYRQCAIHPSSCDFLCGCTSPSKLRVDGVPDAGTTIW